MLADFVTGDTCISLTEFCMKMLYFEMFAPKRHWHYGEVNKFRTRELKV